MKNIQIENQFNTVHVLLIDIDVTIGSNLYNIRGLYNTRTNKAKNFSIVQIDSHRYVKSGQLELSKWCEKNGYDYIEMVDYIIKNFKK